MAKTHSTSHFSQTISVRSIRLLAGVACALVINVGTGQAQTIRTVNAGGDLQAALNAAVPGDTIMLAAGATFVGNFVLPAKNGDAFITIRSASPDASLPPAGTRMSPSFSPLLAKLRSPNSVPVLATAQRAHHYRIMLLEFLHNGPSLGEVIALGDGSSQQNTLAVVPHHIVIDRVYIHGDAVNGQKRAIGLNSASTDIINSYISDIKAVGQDSQAIGGWNGPGPYLISNNHLEAAGENILFGGADPSIPNLIPTDIVVSRNYLTKPLAWRTQNWQVKNLFQLKSGKRVRIDANVFDGHWASAAAPNGNFIWMKSTNQDGGCTWCETSDVEFVNNIVRNVASGFNLAPAPDNPAVPMSRITIRNNHFEISRARFGGDGRFVLQQGVADVTIEHNTVINDGDVTLYLVEKPSARLKVLNNILLDNNWGVLGQGTGEGASALRAFAADGEFAGNIVVTTSAHLYPGGNFFPASLSAVGFVSLAGGDYRLASSSIYTRGGTDGKNPGVDHSALHGDVGPPVLAPPAPAPAPAPPPSGSPAPAPPPPPPASALAQGSTSGAPSNVSASINGGTVRVTWNPPASGTPFDRFVLEAGTAPGASNAAVVTLGSGTTSLVATSVAPGVYYVRVRAAHGEAMSPPSDELRLVVGAAGECSGMPTAPTGLRAQVVGQHVSLVWSAASGFCSAPMYLLQAGTRPGQSDAAQTTVGIEGFNAIAPAGTYYVRIRAVGPGGTSAPSNEIVVNVMR